MQAEGLCALTLIPGLEAHVRLPSFPSALFSREIGSRDPCESPRTQKHFFRKYTSSHRSAFTWRYT